MSSRPCGSALPSTARATGGAGPARTARRDHRAFTITRYEAAPLADRIWQLRHHHTSYDAAYLALAEGLAAPLYTCDAKLAAGGHHAQVRVVPTSR